MVFLLTDGTPSDRDSYYNTLIDNMKKYGILMLVIGIDEAKNDEYVMRIASCTDLYFA